MDRRHEKYERLIARCKAMEPVPCAVAHPCDESSLRGAVEAGELGLLRPVLVGPKARITALAAQHGFQPVLQRGQKPCIGKIGKLVRTFGQPLPQAAHPCAPLIRRFAPRQGVDTALAYHIPRIVFTSSTSRAAETSGIITSGTTGAPRRRASTAASKMARACMS